MSDDSNLARRDDACGHARKTSRLAQSLRRIGLALGGSAGSALASAETPVEASPSGLHEALRAAPPPQAPKRVSLARWLALAAAVVLGAAAGALACWSVFAR